MIQLSGTKKRNERGNVKISLNGINDGYRCFRLTHSEVPEWLSTLGIRKYFAHTLK